MEEEKKDDRRLKIAYQQTRQLQNDTFCAK